MGFHKILSALSACSAVNSSFFQWIQRTEQFGGSGVFGARLRGEGIAVRIPIPKSPNPGEFGAQHLADVGGALAHSDSL